MKSYILHEWWWPRCFDAYNVMVAVVTRKPCYIVVMKRGGRQVSGSCKLRHCIVDLPPAPLKDMACPYLALPRFVFTLVR